MVRSSISLEAKAFERLCIVLEDGSYDALVVDADDVGDGDGALRLSLAIAAGPHKGEVVDVRAEGLGVDAIDVLGLPVTLTVAEGRPSVRLDY